MKPVSLGFLLIASTAVSAFAAEKYYQKFGAAHQGQAEIVLEDQTRADMHHSHPRH